MEVHAKVPIAFAEVRLCWLFDTVGGPVTEYQIEGRIYKGNDRSLLR